jgi:hypothetical protein
MIEPGPKPAGQPHNPIFEPYRVRRLNPATFAAGQAEIFAAYRYHAVFTDSPEPMLDAEATHRDHAIIEGVIADLKTPRWRTCLPLSLAR